MASTFVRANRNSVLAAVGIVLLLLAIRDAQVIEAIANHYRIPPRMLVGAVVRDVILGLALLFVAVRKSKFAGTTAVIVATFLIFSVTLWVFSSFVFTSFHVSWRRGIDLALAFVILWPSLFPWSRSANKPVLFWMALTFGTLTLLAGGAALLARI